jgi:hypothetical protein
VDVWILNTLARRYGLDNWRTPQLAQFGRVHFGPLAGLAQQYLFAGERAQKKAGLIYKPDREINSEAKNHNVEKERSTGSRVVRA